MNEIWGHYDKTYIHISRYTSTAKKIVFFGVF